jgi:hypothetical protein
MRRKLKVMPGSVLVKVYKGVTHAVLVVSDGLVWNGKLYSSATAVAKKITGSPMNINGREFLGAR